GGAGGRGAVPQPGLDAAVGRDVAAAHTPCLRGARVPGLGRDLRTGRGDALRPGDARAMGRPAVRLRPGPPRAARPLGLRPPRLAGGRPSGGARPPPHRHLAPPTLPRRAARAPLAPHTPPVLLGFTLGAALSPTL